MITEMVIQIKSTVQYCKIVNMNICADIVHKT